MPPSKSRLERRSPAPLKKDAPKSRFNPLQRAFWNKKRVAAAFAVFLLGAGLLFGGQAWLKLRQIFEGGGTSALLQEEVDPATLRGEGDGRVNILLVGRDDIGEGLTDTILVASINPIQKEAAILSIPRDLYVRTSDGSYSKINAVFANTSRNYLKSAGNNSSDTQRKAEDAGINALQEIVQTNIGLPIHYYGMIDLEGFMKAINTVGGIDIDVPESATVYDVMRFDGQRYILDVKEGRQHFDGLRAMAFARSRHTSSRGDFDRAERQRLILTALRGKVLSLGTFGNPTKVSRLMNDFGSHIRTNMGLEEAMRLYEIGKGIDGNAVASVALVDPPHDYLRTDNINGQSVVVPKAGLDNYRDVQHFVRNRLRDGFLAQEDAKVAIFNGTSIPGLASRTAENLKSFGYTVTEINDAPTPGYHTTMVVDLTDGAKKYTKRYLENRFFTGARKSVPDPQIAAGEADFVIILGLNEQTRLAN